MASPDVFNIEELLAPIPGDSPTGTDIREDFSPASVFHKIKDVRNTARADERRIITAEPSEAANIRPDWSPLLTLVPETLKEKSKDIEITAWLIESLARHHGFPGLRDGFKLVRRLCEQYWDGLFPMPDEEGMEGRMSALTGLNGDDAEGTLIAPILKIPVTAGSNGSYSTMHYRQAGDLEKIEDESRKQARIDGGAVSLPMFEREVEETPAEYFKNLKEDIVQAQDEFYALSELLGQKAGRFAPPSSTIKSTLDEVLHTVESVAKNKLAVAEPGPEGAAEGGAAQAGAAGGGGFSVPVGAIANREEAFKTLLRLAEFFKKTEPHSPISYAITQAVEWGRLPLPELLKKLIPDDGPRDYYFKMTGIQPPES